jgi:hypothetical protein
MSARTLAVIFASCFFVLAAVSLPLSAVVGALGLESRGITYSRVEGTLWSGRLHGLAWRGRDLGDAVLTVNPLTLLLARVQVEIALEGRTGVTGAGRFTLWPNGSLSVRNAWLSADVAALPVVLPLTGNLRVDIAHADFTRAGCRTVDAHLQTNALVNRPAGLNWQGPVLSGTARCEDGTLTLPLSGGGGAEQVTVTMSLAGDGGFHVQTQARTADEAVKRALSLAGFTDVDGAMTLIQTGRWS